MHKFQPRKKFFNGSNDFFQFLCRDPWHYLEQLFALAFSREKSPSKNENRPWKTENLEVLQSRHGTQFRLKTRSGIWNFRSVFWSEGHPAKFRLWQGQKRPNDEFLKIFSKTALTIFLIFCEKIPNPIRSFGNFSLKSTLPE